MSDSFSGVLVNFVGVEHIDAGDSNGVSYVAGATASIGSLAMDSDDRFVVEVGGAPGSPSINVLTIGDATLAGTLEFHSSGGVPAELATALSYIDFGNAPTGAFEAFAGLALSNTTYLKLLPGLAAADARSVVAITLPDAVSIDLPTQADADAFFARLSGALANSTEAVPVTVTVASQALSGNASVTVGSGSVTIALTDAEFRFGDADDPLLVIGDASVSVTLDADDVTASVSGTVDSSIDELSVSGSFTVAIDSDGAAGTTPSIVATGTGVTLTVAGQEIAGGTNSITIQRTSGSGTPELVIANLGGTQLKLGGTSGAPVVTATLHDSIYSAPAGGGPTPPTKSPRLVVSSNGLRVESVDANGGVGPVQVTVSVAGSADVDLVKGAVAGSADFTLQLDTTTEPGTFRIAATGASLTVGEHTFTTDFTLDELRDLAGRRTVVLGVTGLSGALKQDTGPPALVSVTGGSGTFVLSSAGLAGSASAAIALAITGMSLTTGQTTIEFNSTGEAVDTTVTAGTSTTSVRLPSGPFFRVRVNDAQATVSVPTVGGVALSGDLVFELSGTSTVVGVSDMSVSVPTAGIFGGEGAFVATSDGVAGVISGKATLAVGNVAVGGRLGLRINSTGHAVAATTVTVDERTFTIAFGNTELNVLDVFGSIQSLSLGGFVTLEGDVTFDSGGLATIAAGTVIFLGEGPARISSTVDNPAARGSSSRSPAVAQPCTGSARAAGPSGRSTSPAASSYSASAV